MKGEAIGSKFALKLPSNKRPEPDVVIVPAGKVNDFDSVFEGIPLLVVEILSPSTREHDLQVKKKWFRETQVPEIWIVDLEEESIILDYLESENYETTTYTSGKTLCQSFKQLEISLEDIFEG